jgi:transcription initiation factor TFIID TATA-box-binding protein
MYSITHGRVMLGEVLINCFFTKISQGKSMKNNKIVFGEKLQGIPFVASTSLGRPIDLEKTVNTIDNTMYEPEQLPALICRINGIKALILLFGSGKLVCSGPTKEDVYRAIQELDNSLKLAS